MRTRAAAPARTPRPPRCRMRLPCPGVRVKMITGDHTDGARDRREMGITTPWAGRVQSGAQLVSVSTGRRSVVLAPRPHGLGPSPSHRPIRRLARLLQESDVVSGAVSRRSLVRRCGLVGSCRREEEGWTTRQGLERAGVVADRLDPGVRTAFAAATVLFGLVLLFADPPLPTVVALSGASLIVVGVARLVESGPRPSGEWPRSVRAWRDVAAGVLVVVAGLVVLLRREASLRVRPPLLDRQRRAEGRQLACEPLLTELTVSPRRLCPGAIRKHGDVRGGRCRARRRRAGRCARGCRRCGSRPGGAGRGWRGSR